MTVIYACSVIIAQNVCVFACSHAQDLISLAEFTAQICRTSCQDERDEDSLTILSSDYIKAQTRGSSVDHNTPRIPDMRKKDLFI